MPENDNRVTRQIPLPGGRFLTVGGKTLVMGILNCTPDSFSDGGRYANVRQAVEAALGMVAEGADIIDVGGESTRPGADGISAEEEAARVTPVIAAIRKISEVPISIDTSKAGVAKAALDAGADIVNDVTAFVGDSEMAPLVASRRVPAILMHMQGTPRTMQDKPDYADVVEDVIACLCERVEYALSCGIDKASLILDPGFGFGKTFEHNAALLMRLDEISGLGFPILAGLSRKSMIEKALGLPVAERMEASLALAVMAAERGAAVVRVHDVKETARALGMFDAVRAAGVKQ